MAHSQPARTAPRRPHAPSRTPTPLRRRPWRALVGAVGVLFLAHESAPTCFSVVDVTNKDALDSALTNRRFILGDRFSAADVYVGSQVGFGLMFKTIEPRAAFQRYWQEISARPAAVRAREADDALIAKSKQATG